MITKVGYGEDNDYVIPTGSNPVTTINTALAAASPGDAVILQKDIYKVFSGTIQYVNGVVFQGSGSTFIDSNRHSYVFGNMGASPSVIDGFQLHNVTLELGARLSGHGLRNMYVENCVFSGITIKNGADCWGINHGVPNSATDDYRNSGNQYINITIDGHSGTYEMFALYNDNGVTVDGLSMLNKRAGNPSTPALFAGPALGLWQKVNNARFTNVMTNNIYGSSVYVNVTCNELLFDNLSVVNGKDGIVIGGLSDNGDFGASKINDIAIRNFNAVGGTNTGGSPAIKLGACDNIQVIDPKISQYQIGVNLFDGGNASATATNWQVINPTFSKMNPLDAPVDQAPLFLFNSIGGNLTGRVLGGSGDMNVVGFAFNGAFTWEGIKSAGMANQSSVFNDRVKTLNGALIETTVEV